MPSVVSTFEERIVLFLDFLGFSNELARWNEEEANRVKDVLQWTVASNSEYSCNHTGSMNGMGGRKIIPALTAFSDNIVVSYPAQGPSEYTYLEREWINDVVINEMQRIVYEVSAKAFKINLLVRGGIARGPLYHAGGVVFGRGLIEAYHIERDVANFPRIAISQTVFEGPKPVPIESSRLLIDTDGVLHLTYIRDMLRSLVPDGPAEGYPERMEQSISECYAAVERNMTELDRNKCVRQLEKWRWFRAQLEAAAHGHHDDHC